MWLICHLSSFNKNTTLVVLAILTCLEPQVSAHWCVLMRGVTRCDLQIAQQGCSVPPANIFFTLPCVAVRIQYLRPLLLLGTVLNLNEQMYPLKHPIQGLGHWLICYDAAPRPAGQISAFFLSHFVYVFIHLFSYGLHIKQSSVLDVIRGFFFHVVYQPVASKCPVWLDGQCYQISANCCPTREKKQILRHIIKNELCKT